ncbi:MAG: hypothetical protein EBR82_09625 [Caulobacteraceae bacterium]|nr:hypothetical protein [Caulobacteraceae bacterium]
MKNLAAGLLLLGVIRHVLWEHVEAQALVWNLCGALVIGALLVQVWRQNRSVVVGLVVLWFLYEEAMVAICSTWRILDWWYVGQGEEQCSARIGFKIGAFSLVLIGALISRVARHERATDAG